YLWHYVWVTWVHGIGWLRIPVVVALSFATAELSWQLVEKRALAVKRNLLTPAQAGQEPASGQVTAAAVTAVTPAGNGGETRRW
ncbi:MAG: hypothetical protein M0Z87_04905, partial [Actinomycetota bacterium]|nr:hypothetical protein [Actinomycetota bacterium]